MDGSEPAKTCLDVDDLEVYRRLCHLHLDTEHRTLNTEH